MANTWAGTALNQAVTQAAFGNNFYQYTPVSPTKCLRKDEVSFLTFEGIINFDYPAFANKPSNQLIVKSDITTFMAISITSDAGGGCGQTGDQTVYVNAQGTRAFTNGTLTTPFAGTGNYYRVGAGSGDGYSIQIDGSGYFGATYAC